MSFNLPGIIFLALAGSCMALATLLLHQQIGEVNRKLPEAEQESYLWFHLDKIQRIRKRYREFYPSGKLTRWQFLLEAAAFAFLAVAAIVMGFLK